MSILNIEDKGKKILDENRTFYTAFKSRRFRFSIDPFADGKLSSAVGGGGDELIHIRIQQRNGRKTLTTVQGIHEKFDKKKIVKYCKKVSTNWRGGSLFPLPGVTVHFIPVFYPGGQYILSGRGEGGGGIVYS